MVRLVEQAQDCGYGESYEPIDVDALFDEPTVSLRGPWNPTDLIEIGPSADDLPGPLRVPPRLPRQLARPGLRLRAVGDRVTEGTAPTVYAHVATDPGHPGQLALQYWFYYVFNDWNNTHEGDWENIQLVFDADDARAGARGRAGVRRLQPARGVRGGDVGRRQARARRRDASGRLPGGRVARELLRVGALPRQLGGAGRRLRRHVRPERRAPPRRADDPERSGRGAQPRFRGSRSRGAGASCSGRSSTAPRAPT